MTAASQLRFLITAGPTREHIDPIRFISNRSSGKMGYALAAAARAVSPAVTLVSGPTSLPAPAGVEFVPVIAAAEMAAAVWGRFADCDIAIMTAAVCDVRPRVAAREKIKKETFAATLPLEPTPDILAELGRCKTDQFLVGFAAETDHLEAHARTKLAKKNLDLIVANGAAAFDADDNEVLLVWRDGRTEQWPRLPKVELAARLIGCLVRARS